MSRAASMAAAKAALQAGDQVILDVRLLDGDGFDFCECENQQPES